MCEPQMLALAGQGRVFTVKVQSQAQNVVLVALKPCSAGLAPTYSGRDIRQVPLTPQSVTVVCCCPVFNGMLRARFPLHFSCVRHKLY